MRERAEALSILVNNAGATWGAPLEEFPESGWDRVIHTNVEGIFHLTTALLPALREAATETNPARIINIGSVDGLRPPVMENYSYSASKAAVHMLTRHLAKRLASEHITVNAIAPGPFESKMTAFMLDSQDAKEMVEQMVPLGRIGRPDDVVGLTVFLASRAGVLPDRHGHPAGRRDHRLRLTRRAIAATNPPASPSPTPVSGTIRGTASLAFSATLMCVFGPLGVSRQLT